MADQVSIQGSVIAERPHEGRSCIVLRGRRKTVSGWLLVRTRYNGRHQIVRFESETDARAAAAELDSAPPEMHTRRADMATANIVEFLLHGADWRL